MVSLFDLAQFSEEGVQFESPVDGSMMMLSPEKSMDIQNAIGADIMMMLDDVVSSKRVDYARVSGLMMCLFFLQIALVWPLPTRDGRLGLALAPVRLHGGAGSFERPQIGQYGGWTVAF